MDPIEKAIRNALEKGDAEDRAFREKVYRSAFAALDRATQAQPNLTVEVAIKRRRNLQAKITSIESEYLPALPAEPEEAPPVSVAGPEGGSDVAPVVEMPAHAPDGQSMDVPSVEAYAAVDPASNPTVEAVRSPLGSSARRVDVSPDRDDARAGKRRRPLVRMLVAVLLLVAAAFGGWWAYKNGLLDLPPELGLSTPNPPQIVEGEDFDPAEEATVPAGPADPGDLRNWVTVFSPADPSLVNAPTGATAEVSQDESGSFLRIRSGSTGASVVFDVGQGILEQISGKRAVFDIVARAEEEGKQTQISISCDFGELGDCGRRRYAVGYERGEYLFDVTLPAKSPGASGSIAINSDFAKEGRAVDIYEIRVSVVP